MAPKIPEPTELPRERAMLVGVEIFGRPGLLSLEDSLDELELLADTAGLDVVLRLAQRLSKPNPKTFIGPGKVEEAIALADEMAVDVVLFDEELSPRHQRELERLFKNSVRVLDRTALILDIFAQHANTREGALQVELAQYEYRLPRLTRAWTHLARQAGGGSGRTGVGVGLRGPGETQLEVDRREINRRITQLKADLEKVRAHRKRYRARRRKSQLPVVALVGYTNAGKSTLLNKISGAAVYVADQLFATLDPTTRRVKLSTGAEALFTDTVGFIQKLPTSLVAAFQATLEELTDADLLLHVVDATHPNAEAQVEVVHETLSAIGAGDIPELIAMNKIDRLDGSAPTGEEARYSGFSYPISARLGTGVDELLDAVRQQLYESFARVSVVLPYQQGGLISLFHEQGRIESIEHLEQGEKITGRLPERLLSRFLPYMSIPVPGAGERE
ncbi:MAG: GTPase HflX [Anaerolineales bacterium]|nr:GTPase HflX [Anaerolineales bacterium]